MLIDPCKQKYCQYEFCTFREFRFVETKASRPFPYMRQNNVDNLKILVGVDREALTFSGEVFVATMIQKGTYQSDRLRC